MKRKFEVDEQSGIVYLVYSGKVSLEDRLRAAQEIVENYADYKPLKIIVDVRELEMDLSLEDQKTFGQYIALHEGLQDACAAVVHHENKNPNFIIDTQAAIHGLRIAQFDSMKEAKLWVESV